MKFKNMKEKMSYIDGLEKDDNLTIQKKYAVLRKLSKDTNIEIRIFLAQQLVVFDQPEIEDILYEMLFDKNRRVRLEAVDTLSVGRQEKTIEKISTMIEGEGCLIRAFAVSSLFNVIVNCYGMNEAALKKYSDYVAASFKKENQPRVLIEYYLNQYYCGDEEGFRLLEGTYKNAVDLQEYSLVWPLLHMFGEMRNRGNSNQIDTLFLYKKEMLLDAQIEVINQILKKEVRSKILIVDEQDVYLSHLLGETLKRISDFEITTAGINVGKVENEKIKEFCERNSLVNKESYYSYRITDIYLYDYVVCINLENQDNYFSLCNRIDIKSGHTESIEDEILEMCEKIVGAVNGL